MFLHYRCRNCGETLKTYALSLDFEDGPDPKRGTDLTTVKVLKYGEVPQFGPPLPAKLLQLAGANGDLLKKGRQSENQGLGIGAFAYYRRVVELQKSRLIDEISNAVRRLGKNPESLAALEAARSEPNFSKALDLMVGVIPKELYINSQNPLKLLHGPLSAGIHGKSDEECLTQAHSVRVVLGALLARIQMVTQDEEELDAAIKDLLSPPEQEIDSSVK